MKTIELVKKVCTDEQILECLILFEKRKLEASKRIAGYLWPKYKFTTLEAYELLRQLKDEF